MDFGFGRTPFGQPPNQGHPRCPPTASGSSTGFPFNIPIPKIDLSALQETLSPKNLFPANIDQFVQTVSGGQQRPANGGQSSGQEMPCDGCGARFTFIKRRKTCCECRQDFCMSCVARLDRSKYKCRRCQVLTAVPLDRQLLMGLKVRDLRWFLAKHRVPAHYCKEKSELVDLIMSRSGHRPSYDQRSQQPSTANYRSQNYQSPQRSPDDDSWTFIGPDGRFQDSYQSGPVNRDPVNRPSQEQPATTDNSRRTQETSQEAQSTVPKEEDLKTDDFKPFNLSDVTSLDQIHSLSVRQLKLLLARNFVDFKGCCEKDELIRKAERLWLSRQNKDQVEGDGPEDESNVCKVCMERDIDCVLLECGHIVVCTDCGKKLNECPVCRQYIVRVVRTFKS